MKVLLTADVKGTGKKGDVVEVGVIRQGERTVLQVTLEQDASFVNMSDTRTLLYSMNIF